MVPSPKPSWRGSSLPFFVVLQDESTYVPGDIVESEESETRALHGTFISNTLYPEVRYIFSDDDFGATTEALEQSKDDISVIIDVDSSGEQVENCQSLSSNWQVTGATVTTASSPAWMGQDASNSFKLVVRGTSSSIIDNSRGLIRRDGELPAVDRIKQYIQTFRDRNEQLQALLKENQ
jgi:hypothetical protein